MNKLLRHELYQLRNNWTLVVITILIFGFCVFATQQDTMLIAPGIVVPVGSINEMFGTAFETFEEFQVWNARFDVKTVIGNALLPLVFGTILAAFFIGQDFGDRTMNLRFMQGHTRSRVFLAKLLNYYILGLIMSFSAMFLTLSIFEKGWTTYFTAGEIAQCLLLRFFSDIGTLSIPFFLAFVLKDLVGTIAVSAGYAILLSRIIAASEVRQNLINTLLAWHPAYQLRAFMQSGVDGSPAFQVLDVLPEGLNYIAALVIGTLLLATISTASAYLIFRRTELR